MKKMIHFRQRILRGPGLRILRDPGRLRHVVLQAMVQTTASHVLRDGELALLMEPRRRHKPRLIKLDSARETETSLGRLRHTDVIGQEVGVQLRTSLGGKVTLRRPSLEEYTLLMSRGATPSYCSVIYTAICMLDIGPGSKVVEAGTGSGAMTLHLSRLARMGVSSVSRCVPIT
jgi:tRNA A58 N-methylase Trm61